MITQTNTFSYKLLSITFFAQQLQSDKIHHWEAKKISYLVVYLVILLEFFPGMAFFWPDSTGL